MKKEKKELSEKQKEVIEKNKFRANCPTVARKNQKKAVKARKKNQEEKIEREAAAEYAWKKFFGTDEKLEDFWESLSPKDKKDVFNRLLPPEKQTQEILGNLGIEKIFITQEEKNATDKHIDDFINDTTTE